MRPLTLRLEGLRSYRVPQTLDFTDHTMVAIVGDTGAGKSSLLEAVTFALYGGTTWSKQPGELIGDRSDTMKVELTFLADGTRWRITRTMSTTRASTHRLENLDTGDRFDGAREILAVVERVVGLDYDGFLRTVLLPQGKFAKLLEASPAERQKILRNVFRVDELERVRERAKGLHERLQPRLGFLQHARRQLPDDPREAAAAAAVRAEASEARKAELGGATEEVAAARSAADEARRAADDLTRATAAMELPVVECAARDVRAIATADVDHRERVEATGEAFAAAVAALDAATDAHARAADGSAGHGEGALRAARGAVSALPGLAADIADLVATRRAGDSQAAAAAAEEQEVEQARTGLATAEDDAEHLDREIAATSAKVAALAAAIEAAGAADAQLAEAEAAAHDAQRRVTGSGDAATRAAAEAQAAADTLRAAQDTVDAARRAGAAAHAASGVEAGEPCPVCARVLPDGFEPPTADGLAEAEQSVDSARQRADQCANAATRAALQHDDARTALRAADDLVAARRAARDEARSALATAARAADAHDRNDVPGGPVDAATLLRAPEEALASAHERRRQAGQRIDALREHLVQARTRAETLRADLERSRAALGRAVASCRTRLDQTLATLEPVPEWQGALPGLADLGRALDAADPAGTAPPPELEVPGIDVAGIVAGIDARLAELDALARAVADCEQRRDRARELRDQAVRQRDEAAAGVAEAHSTLDKLSVRVSDAARQVGHAPVPDPPPERLRADGLDAGAVWAAAVADTARTVAAAVATAVEHHRRAVGRHEAAAAGVLARVGAGSVDELRAQHDRAIGEAVTAWDEHRRRRADIPRADQLDQRIAAAGEFLDAVALVRDRLATSAFVGEVMQRRHAELLGIASRIFGEMTDGRYGFSPGFAIVDLQTRQERATKTLSGGESFLASLALALAMVEIAGRGGGRLDALFLDEGFGSLDRASLDAAIDALESRARAGRLVAVISHVAGVAERIEDVLVVRETASGSVATWQSDTEREASFATDVADLTAAVAAPSPT